MNSQYWRIPTILCVIFIIVVTVMPVCSDEMNAGKPEMIDMLIQQAEKGSPVAQYNLGAFYYLGVKVEQNYPEAYRWLEKSAAQQNPLAQGLLGIMYFKGEGVTQDYQQAYTLLQQSADRGYAIAQAVLAGMYYAGQGMPPDHQKAYKWAVLAAANNQEGAKKLLIKLHQEMSPEQIAAAQQAAHEWRVQQLSR